MCLPLTDLGETAGDLVSVIDKLMSGKHTLAVIETASHGLLGSLCVGRDWLLSASYEQNIARLGQQPRADIEKTSFVPPLPSPLPEGEGAKALLFNSSVDNDHLINTAQALAVDLQTSSRADIILVQLYTGDNHTLHDKNRSIVVYTGLLNGERFEQTSHSIGGSLKRKQNQAALLSLDLLRRYLQDKL